MTTLVNEKATVLSNAPVGPKLHLMTVSAPQIASGIQPGQFVHMRFPQFESHVLRRPFSVYDADSSKGTLDVLYQEVGSVTRMMPGIAGGTIEVIGPIGNTWSADARHALLVGGGVGAAPLFMHAKRLIASGCATDVVLGAQTKDAHVCLSRYAELLGREPFCSTDDGTYGTPGFCTVIVEERLREGCSLDGAPYDYVAVCGPPPLMRIVAGMAADAGVPCEVSMEKRMACGVGACLSCVVDTVSGKKRSCVDGPVFDASEVVW